MIHGLDGRACRRPFLFSPLANARGAVLLLTTYMTVLVMLLLGAVSLQRVMTEIRSAEHFRDMQQAFALAEGTLDQTMIRLKSESLADGVHQGPVSSQNITFSLQTLSAEILNPWQQKVVRRITVTAQVGHGTESVSAYFEETGPLEGIWGRGVSVAHGGSVQTPIITGAMRSGLGIITSIKSPIAQGDCLSAPCLVLDGLAKTDDPAKSPTQQLDDLRLQESPELISLKKGYMFTERIAQGTGEDPSGIEFSPWATQTQIPAVTGTLSLGSAVNINNAGALNPAQCSGTLALPPGKTTIDGTNSALGITDLWETDGKITLCVNAIVPANDTAWLGTMLENPGLAPPPPEVVFTKPVFLFVTGSNRFDLGTTFVGGILGGIGVQQHWDVSVGAKMSAEDASGRVIPNGVNIILTDPLPPQPGQATIPPGLVWVKPGKFSGSIYAPQSLVVVRERSSGDRLYPDESAIPYFLQSVAGNEVIIELKTDQVEIGGTTVPKDPSRVTIKFLGGWTSGS